MAAGVGLGLLAGCSASRPSEGDQSGTRPPGTDAASGEESPGEPMDGTPASPAVVDDRTETFVSRLADGAFEWAAGMFGGVLAGDDAGRLAATWRGLTIQHGPFAGYEIVGRQVRADRSLRAVELRFESDSQRLSLVFDPYVRVVGLDFPTREPRRRDPGEGRSFDHQLTREGDDGCPLGATITLPDGDDTVPGVVILHRSGPLDRDGSVGPNRPYRDLAAGLAARGVASIRYDKRSFVCHLGKEEQSLDDVIVADAVAAVERLGRVERVSDVAVFGHGIGGVAAPLVAREADVAGLILGATPTRPLSEVFFRTERRKAEADGEVTREERQRLDYVGEKLNATADLGPDDDYYILGTATTFWRDLRGHDVVAAVRGRPEPVLALHPERGFVTTATDRRVWRDVLPPGAVREYPDLDHLFMHVFEESLPEAYFFPDTLSTEVVDDVAAWVTGPDS